MNSIQHNSRQLINASSTHSNQSDTNQPLTVRLLNEGLAASPQDRAVLRERFAEVACAKETFKNLRDKENFEMLAKDIFDSQMKHAQPKGHINDSGKFHMSNPRAMHLTNDSGKQNRTKNSKRSTEQKKKRVHVSAIRPDPRQTNPLSTNSNQIRTNQPTPVSPLNPVDLLNQVPNANSEDQQELKALYIEAAITVASSINNPQEKINHIRKAEKIFKSQINKPSSAESISSPEKRADYLGNISSDMELFDQLSLQPTTADSGEEG